MRVPQFIVVTWLALIWALAPAHAEKRVALVVGNSKYTNISPLRNPVGDARLIADTLRGLGFTLTGNAALIDLDKTGLDRAVQSFGAQLQSADVALFYYAGHGIQLRGANYLVPVDANVTREADAEFQMLNVNRVLEQIEPADGSGGRLNVVILDACRNNPFGNRLRSADRGLSVMQAPGGTLISFATQPGAAAQDGDGDHSPFTAALADSIRRPGLGLFDVFNEIGLSVKQATGGTQQPWVSSSPIAGQFYFAGLPQGGGQSAREQTAGVPPAPEAARAWAAVQNSASLVALDEFMRQFGNVPIYGALARERREELAKGVVDAHNKIATQEATIEQFDLQITAQQANVEQAQAKLASAQADQKQTQQEVYRVTPLVRQSSIPERTLEQASVNLDRANAAVQNAQAVLDAAVANTDLLRAQKKEAIRILEELKNRAPTSGSILQPLHRR